MQPTPSTNPPSQRKSLWLDWRIRAVVSLLILVHLAAVILPPTSMEGSPLASRGWYGLRAYIEAAYLNHGYHFFAPQPGPSHLIRFELELDNGDRQDGIFPSKDNNWPRLLYHRHFMLTEFLNVLNDGALREAEIERQRLAANPLSNPPRPPANQQGPYYPPVAEDVVPEEAAPTTTDRELLEAYCRSYADHLLKRYQARRVTIHLVRHLIPFPEDVRAGQRLDDPQLYRELFQKTFEANWEAEGVAPPPVAQLVPIQGRAGRRR